MRTLWLMVILFAFVACSLPPERPITKDELYQTNIYNFYTINDSPESVLAALNREGEVILDAKFKDRPLFIKILAESQGLKVSVYEQ